MARDADYEYSSKCFANGGATPQWTILLVTNIAYFIYIGQHVGSRLGTCCARELHPCPPGLKLPVAANMKRIETPY